MKLPLARIESVLLAGAAGDGIGGTFEGQGPDPERQLPRPPWRVSDDTRMTFATCRGIARTGGVDPAAIAKAFLEELRTGLPGVGSSTLKALRDLAAGQHWALSGARGEFAAGNGAAMRIAPLAFFGDAREPAFARVIRDIASITHRNDEAITAAVAFVAGMQLVADSHPRQAILTSLIDSLPDTALSDSLTALAALSESATSREAANEVGTSGRAAQSVALALFIGSSTSTIETAILEALRCGGDTDTIASLAAQMRAAAGTEVPVEWLPHLPTEEVRRLSGSLVGRDEPQPTTRRRWWGIF
jgi:ADP-ribosyl-[dinitrogen reductase] hydrolase